MFRVSFKGEKEMAAKVKKFAAQFPDKARGAVFRFAEKRIMTPAKKQYTPIRTGNLAGTGIVTSLPKPKIGAILSFGGTSADYAVPVHEILGRKYQHGGPKYLERPFLAAVSTAGQELANEIKIK